MTDEQTQDNPQTAEAALRGQVLEHLVEIWYSQDERLDLAKLWESYEQAIAAATRIASDAFARDKDDFLKGVQNARAAIRDIEGLTLEQRSYAFETSLREQNTDSSGADEGYAGAAARRARASRKDMGLQSAQLVSMVADFELFVLRITSAWLACNSDHLANRKRELTFSEIIALDSIEELRESVIRDFLGDHMRKSAPVWLAEFCKLFGVSSIFGMKDFTTLEVFQRRHIIVHHGGTVSQQYLDSLKEFKLAINIGDELPVDLDYVQRAADSLASMAHSIAMAALISSTASDPGEREMAEVEAGELTYILLTLSRNVVVDRFITNFDVSRVKRQFSREQLRVNGWIAKRRLGTLSQVRSDIEAWDTSASADSFKLGKLVLLDERNAAIKMAISMIEQKRLTRYSIAVWPLFEDIKDDIFSSLAESEHDSPKANMADAPQDAGSSDAPPEADAPAVDESEDVPKDVQD